MSEFKRANEANDWHHPKQRGSGNAPDIHVIVGEKNVEGLEKEIRGSVTQSVADVLARFQAVRCGGRLRFSSCGQHRSIEGVTGMRHTNGRAKITRRRHWTQASFPSKRELHASELRGYLKMC